MDSRSELDQQNDRALAGTTLQPETLARGLGWFSIALGIGELIAPRAFSRLAGSEDRAGLTRLYGLRELVCGVGILASRNPGSFLWARVGGDVLDLGTLAMVSNNRDSDDRRRAMKAVANVACVTALDVYAARGLSNAAFAGTSARTSFDYSDRSGFARAPAEMRGAALADLKIPRDMRTPEALEPFTRKATSATGETGTAGSANGRS